MNLLYPLIRSALFSQDPEKAHELMMMLLSKTAATPLNLFYKQSLPYAGVTSMGLNFKNPVGLAAGLDKNGECIDALGLMGFGFIEVGTVTPKAQDGNPKPRIFRLKQSHGLVNRMGFNNLGVDHLLENVKKRTYSGILGINIGKNKDTPLEHSHDDYLTCLEKVYDHADYIAINISSPNTPDLRKLQYGEMLDDLLKTMKQKQAQLHQTSKKYVPIALKIAPDLTLDEIHQIADSLIRFQIDGVIATNTTLDRSMVKGSQYADEIGGLSGRPIAYQSTKVVEHLSKELNGKLPIIGVGGIDSGMRAKEKMIAGASLVQIYSGFIYQGPGLIKEIVHSV